MLLRFLFLLLLMQVCFAKPETLPIENLKLPPGFKIEIFAYPVADARSLALGERDTVFVGTKTDKVYAIVKDAHTRFGTRVITLASGLNGPNGVAFYRDDLYVAEVDRILRFPKIEENIHNDIKPETVLSALPKEHHHGLRYIGFGSDNKLYVAIGMPCNICLLKNPLYGTIYRLNPDGTQFEIYAKGIRNSVGFDWHPVTHHLWFTDNGRDWLGDNEPPDELNEITAPQLHFGFPYFNARKPDPMYGKKAPAITFVNPKVEIPAHSAALGMKFYTGNSFPAEYHQQIFIAEHGSWNRSRKIGYQVAVANLQNGKTKPFVVGWLKNENVWGRPVDLLVMKDGSLLISDDFAGVIYRVSYEHNIKLH